MTDHIPAGGADVRPLVQSLDGPSGLTFRRSTPPEPIGTRRLVITATTFDGSDAMVLVDREDSPVWPEAPRDALGEPDDAQPDPGDESAPVTLAARACGHCGRDITKRRKGCLYCDGACRVAAHRDPAQGDVVAKAERRARKATPCAYPREDGRR